MGATIRSRFVALVLAEGWIEQSRSPLWTLCSLDGTASLNLRMFPVADGVLIDLETLRALEHERHKLRARDRRAELRGGVPAATGIFFVDETSWSEGTAFCVASTTRLALEALGFAGLRGLRREWTVSDGKHVLEASLWVDADEVFAQAADTCEKMIRSVRFEGPS
jgi:hypothetical protein